MPKKAIWPELTSLAVGHFVGFFVCALWVQARYARRRKNDPPKV